MSASFFRCTLLAAVLLGCTDTRPGTAGSGAGEGPPVQTPPDAAGADSAVAAIDSEPTPAQWTAGSVRQEHAPAGVAILGDVRMARNEGFDRVVFEFEDDRMPSYFVEYVDRPIRQCGSGDVVPVAGDGWLLIRLEPANAHDEQGQPTVTERSVQPDLPVLRELTLICDFEAQVEWVLGVSTPNRYRIMELVEPTRLLIDVRH